jgi:hypothetical protein
MLQSLEKAAALRHLLGNLSVKPWITDADNK